MFRKRKKQVRMNRIRSELRRAEQVEGLNNMVWGDLISAKLKELRKVPKHQVEGTIRAKPWVVEWDHGLFKDKGGRRPLCPELVREGGRSGVRDIIGAGLL